MTGGADTEGSCCKNVLNDPIIRLKLDMSFNFHRVVFKCTLPTPLLTFCCVQFSVTKSSGCLCILTKLTYQDYALLGLLCGVILLTVDAALFFFFSLQRKKTTVSQANNSISVYSKI